MTETTERPTATDCDGKSVPIPIVCPLCCDIDHAACARDNDGALDAEDITRHYGYGTQGFARTIVNSVGGRVERAGGNSRWDIVATQGLVDPLSEHSAYDAPPLIRANLADGPGPTTGEVRVFVAQMLAMCDRVDLAEIVRPAVFSPRP